MPVRRFRYQSISILDVFDLLPCDRNEVAGLLFDPCEYFGPIKGVQIAPRGRAEGRKGYLCSCGWQEQASRGRLPLHP